MELGSVVFFRRKKYRLESVAEISIFFRSLSAKGKTSIVSSHDRVSCITIVQDKSDRLGSITIIAYFSRQSIRSSDAEEH
jgi:hypothetical protein